MNVENKWNIQIQDAKWKYQITTSGDHKCPKCGNNHSSGVCHQKCGQGSYWFWVDGPTNFAICSKIFSSFL